MKVLSDLRNLAIIVLALGLLVLGTILFIKGKQVEKFESYKNAYDILNTKHTELNNKLGQASAKIETVEGFNTELVTSLKSNDSEIKRLQKLVAAYKKELEKAGGSVTIVTDTITVTDTLEKIVNDDYIGWMFSDEWISLLVYEGEDKPFDLNITNKYSVVLGTEKDGWFKRKPFTLVTNENPYSRTSSVKSFKVIDKTPKFKLGFSGGYGLTYVDKEVRLAPSIIFGINYNL